MVSLPEQIIAEVFALMPQGVERSIEQAVGRRETYTHAGVPRVVAIPLGAPAITQPTMPGGRKLATKDGGEVSRRTLLLRHFQIDWEITDAPKDPNKRTFGDVEDLYLQTLVALRYVCHHSVSFEQERWISQEEGADGFDMYGSIITFRSTIEIPVLDRPLPCVKPSGVETTYKLNDEPVEDQPNGG